MINLERTSGYPVEDDQLINYIFFFLEINTAQNKLMNPTISFYAARNFVKFKKPS
jgi:hypothetical protein